MHSLKWVQPRGARLGTSSGSDYAIEDAHLPSNAASIEIWRKSWRKSFRRDTFLFRLREKEEDGVERGQERREEGEKGRGWCPTASKNTVLESVCLTGKGKRLGELRKIYLCKPQVPELCEAFIGIIK